MESNNKQLFSKPNPEISASEVEIIEKLEINGFNSIIDTLFNAHCDQIDKQGNKLIKRKNVESRKRIKNIILEKLAKKYKILHDEICKALSLNDEQLTSILAEENDSNKWLTQQADYINPTTVAEKQANYILSLIYKHLIED